MLISRDRVEAPGQNYSLLTYLLTYILILVVLQLYRMLKECQLKKYILQHTYKFTTSSETLKLMYTHYNANKKHQE